MFFKLRTMENRGEPWQTVANRGEPWRTVVRRSFKLRMAE